MKDTIQKRSLRAKKIKLDIGCGYNKRKDCIGIDISEDSDADIIASAFDLPFPDGSVDEIYSNNLIEHFFPNEAKLFFSEIYRVLKKGGRAFIKIDRDWSKKRLLHKDPTHKYRYSSKDIKKLIINFSKVEIKNKYYFQNRHFRNKIFVDLIK